MAKQVIFTCDRCKKEIPEGTVWNVGIKFKAAPAVPSEHDYQMLQVQWCRPCADQYHCLLKRKHVGESQPIPTLSEELERILGEMIEEYMEGRDG